MIIDRNMSIFSLECLTSISMENTWSVVEGGSGREGGSEGEGESEDEGKVGEGEGSEEEVGEGGSAM
jgi:hypothetical protein